jgi:uncharacterized protein YdeI (YjbR/CyaY-like superfamily)
MRASLDGFDAKVDAYIARAPQWRDEMQALRALLVECGLQEQLKWGKPCFTFEGRNVAIIQPFKKLCALMFFKGALIEDSLGHLRPQGENTQSAMRLEFIGEAPIPKTVVRHYAKQAIAVEKAGLKVDAGSKPELAYPAELSRLLDDDANFASAFEALTPGRRRGWLLHFSAARQSPTRTARIEKAIPDILAGRGLHDR